MPNKIGHGIITRAALASLPVFCREFLGDEADHLVDEYCMYGDDYFVRPDELAPYVVMPDGRLPMDPWEIRIFSKEGAGRDFYECGYYRLMRDAFDYFSCRGLEAIRAGDAVSFAKFMGTIAHVIEDSSAPAHALGTDMGTDLKFIRLLTSACGELPKLAALHPLFEAPYLPYTLDYQPQFLGESAEEISFVMLEKFTEIIEFSISHILDIHEALVRDDAHLRGEVLSECGRKASEAVADYLFTLLAVGLEREDVICGGRQNFADLSEFTPLRRTAWQAPPYGYCEMVKSPWSISSDSHAVPLALNVANQSRVFDSGFGFNPFYEACYLLPQAVYGSFSAWLGGNAQLGLKAPVIFEFFGDGRLLHRERVESIRKASFVRFSVEGTEQFRFSVRYDSEQPFISDSHVVMAEPKLEK